MRLFRGLSLAVAVFFLVALVCPMGALGQATSPKPVPIPPASEKKEAQPAAGEKKEAQPPSAPEKKEAQPAATAPTPQAAPTAATAPSRAEEKAKELPIKPALLIGLILSCLVWIAGISWLNSDALENMIHRSTWTLVLLGVGILGLTAIYFVHGYCVWGMLGSLTVVMVSYVWYRNKQVHASKRVLTLTHFDRKLWHIFSRMGLIKPGKAVEVSKGLANITLIRHDGTPAEAESGRPYGGDARALLIIKQLISQGLTEHATDIHFDPKPTEVSVRLRMDGILHAYPSLKLDLGPKVMTAVKVLAAMDIAKKNVAQDGSFSAQVYTKHIDLRVASQPGIHGEIMTVRILNRDTDLIRLERLGMRPDQQARIKALIQSPNGVCLVSGPTGAGKTTTLYAAIQDIDARQRHILTIENPVEYRLPNVNQTSINPKAGVTFATALRASLRQDPNIIMVGEIRDAETARTAMSAAMTGHLVLTTVHATDSITALFRLFDLTIEPYLIASAMKMIIAQRLVRLLCAKCRVSTQLRPDQLRKLGIVSGPGVSIFKAKGCSDCHGTGYSGRTGIFEILDISSKIREMIAAKATRDTIKQEARRGGFISLMEDGIRKVAAGMTSLEELSRVVR